ncbi:hypothetical protein ELK75_30570, partial [Klebsiella pneumoniae]|nr:hypothetical protein [Klebsiella pneumoniae]
RRRQRQMCIRDSFSATLNQIACRLRNIREEDNKALKVARSASGMVWVCLLYTSPSPRDYAASRMPACA